MALTYELAGGGTIIEKSLGRMRNVQVCPEGGSRAEPRIRKEKCHTAARRHGGGDERGGRVSAGLEEHRTVSQNRLRF